MPSLWTVLATLVTRDFDHHEARLLVLLVVGVRSALRVLPWHWRGASWCRRRSRTQCGSVSVLPVSFSFTGPYYLFLCDAIEGRNVGIKSTKPVR